MTEIEPQHELTADPELGAAISREVVGVYVKLYGRGPSRARTHLGDGFVMTVLDETFTQAERTLVAAGHGRQVEETRRAFQEAAREDFVAIVEGQTGRGVMTFMSQVDVATGTAIELFLLDPDAFDGAPADVTAERAV